MLKNSNLHWIWLSLLIIILDQWTKQLAMQYLLLAQPHVVMPFLNFTLAYNTGAAFSFLSHAAGWQRWFFIGVGAVVSVIVLIWLGRLSRSEKLQSIGLVLILGGALSNIWDRLYYGFVIDFIDVYAKHWHWPTFNLADSAITIGVILLLLTMMVKKRI